MSFTHLVSRYIDYISTEPTYIERAQLGVGILVAYASFEGAHSLLRIDGLGSNDIGNLEIECNILSRIL